MGSDKYDVFCEMIVPTRDYLRTRWGPSGQIVESTRNHLLTVNGSGISPALGDSELRQSTWWRWRKSQLITAIGDRSTFINAVTM